MKLRTAYYPDYFPPPERIAYLGWMNHEGFYPLRILVFGCLWPKPEPDRLERFLKIALQGKIGVCLATPTRTLGSWFFERHLFPTDSLHIYAKLGASKSWFFIWHPTRGGRKIGMNGFQTFAGKLATEKRAR